MATKKTAKLRWEKIRWEHLGGWKRTRVGPESAAYAKIKESWNVQVTVSPHAVIGSSAGTVTVAPVRGGKWKAVIEEFDGDVFTNEFSVTSPTERGAKARAQYEVDFLRSL